MEAQQGGWLAAFGRGVLERRQEGQAHHRAKATPCKPAVPCLATASQLAHHRGTSTAAVTLTGTKAW